MAITYWVINLKGLSDSRGREGTPVDCYRSGSMGVTRREVAVETVS